MKMLLSRLLPLGYLIASIVAAKTTSDDGVLVLTGATSTSGTATVPTGSYITYSSTITVSKSSQSTGSTSSTGSTTTGSATGNSTSGSTTITSSTESRTLLAGSTRTHTSSSSINGTATGNSTISSTSTSTSTSAQPTNTTPCNNYAEFCARKYSNLTQVAAHNSPFVGTGAAANQAYSVTTQLNDGIRLVQGQTHRVNGTLRLCHTSCELLDAGPLVNWLKDINTWVEAHPYDVVTILIGNGDYNWVENFTAPFEQSGLTKYTYEPPVIPMSKDDWPTLASMILAGERVVVFMDYMADQGKVPYLLDEFSQVWETPFDPTDRSFPCTIQRPPDFNNSLAGDRLYIMNHNLNTEISLLGYTLDVPTSTLLNVTNNVTGYGSLGNSSEGCYEDWGTPPTWLNVDYYNVGNGSVFEVAAKWNNVTYTATCCGSTSTSGAETVVRSNVLLCTILVLLTACFLA
jgi:hypothetical protein